MVLTKVRRFYRWKIPEEKVKTCALLYVECYHGENTEFFLCMTSPVDVQCTYKFILGSDVEGQTIVSEEDLFSVPHCAWEKGFLKDGYITLDVEITLKPIIPEPNPCHIIPSIASALWDSKTFADFTIFADDDEIKVHKDVLSIVSPVFKTMLNSDCIESRENQIKIKEFDFKTVEISMKLIYEKDVLSELDLDLAMDIYRFVDKYGMNYFMKKLEGWFETVKLTEENIWKVTSFAHRFNAPFVKQLCSDFLVENLQQSSGFEGYDSVDSDIIKEVYRTTACNPIRCKKDQFLSIDGICKSCHPYCTACTSYGTSVGENDCMCSSFFYKNSTHSKCVENCENYSQNPDTGELCQQWSEIPLVIQLEFIKDQKLTDGETLPVQVSRHEAWWLVLFLAIVACCCFCCAG
ncbi:hypothetical protein FO519_001086 [Halicephalobus sp. NKZ332]|nr:hypothetical protein FO519_001086 [Halicephalobus sp. NKZ332]